MLTNPEDLSAKTVSLNELIAAEEREKKTALGDNLQRLNFKDFHEIQNKTNSATEDQIGSRNALPLEITMSKNQEDLAQPTSTEEITAIETQSRRGSKKLPTSKLRGLLNRLPLVKHLASNSKLRRLRQDRETLTRTLFGDRKISPLKYRKEFHIRSPLKPKKLKLATKSRYKSKNQSKKREISGNGHFKRKDIPLLKSLSMLFDNLIEPDASHSEAIKTKKRKRYRLDSGEIFQENNSRKSSSRSQKKTITPFPYFSTETSSDTANITTSEDYDYSINRQNTSIPILLPRNTLGSRRDNNGSSTRSRPAYNRNIEGNITRDHGTDEYNPGIRKNETYAESNENNTYSNTRSNTSSFEYSRTGRDRYESRNSTNRTTVLFNTSKKENTTDLFRKDKFKTGGIKIESKEYIREPVRRFRGYISKSKSTHDENFSAESVQFQKVHEESILCTSSNSTCHKRIPDKSGAFTIENEKIRSRNETLIFIDNNFPQTEKYFESGGKKTPVVLIFDGYSVTRDKNGENKY